MPLSKNNTLTRAINADNLLRVFFALKKPSTKKPHSKFPVMAVVRTYVNPLKRLRVFRV